MSRKGMLNRERPAHFRRPKHACSSRPFAKDGETMLNFRCLFPRMITYMMSLMSLPGRRAALPLLLCALFCLPGAAAPAKKSPPPVPNMGAVATGMTVSLPDPKYPGTGWLLYYLRAAAFDGGFLPDGTIHGNMTKIWARVYQKGVPTAVLTAPQALGGGTKKSIVITGRGGVVVKSLLEAGTILTADKVVWYVNSSQVVATGHVYYHNGKSGMDFHGPLLRADTKLQSLHTGPGHMTGVF